jgi:peroxiredoxin
MEPSELKIPRSTEQTRVVVLNRMQIPNLEYRTFDEKTVSLQKYQGKPLLINIWASWCSPCLVELADFREHAESLQTSGLNILALSVDGLADDKPRDVAAVSAAFEKLSVPFDGGLAEPRLVSMLERGPGLFLNRSDALPIPSSFLFDSQGKIAIIYTGPVKAAQLQADLELLDASKQELLAAATPFPGHWLNESSDPPASPAVAENSKDARKNSGLVYGVVAGLSALGVCWILYFVRARRR